MRWSDQLRFCAQVLVRQRFRTLMLWLALLVGVLAINLLTGLGEGARHFVLEEFDLLGRSTLIVLPGRKETRGGIPPLTGLAPRDLTLEDARVLARQPHFSRVVPLAAGQAEVSRGNRSRDVLVLGTTRDFFALRRLALTHGQALPPLAMDRAQPVCVISAALARRLFAPEPALGGWLRAGGMRFRVIGVLADQGQSLGLDMSDLVLIPVASAQQLFNRQGLFRLFVEVRDPRALPAGRQHILALLKARHQGGEDVTVISQDSLLATFADLLQALTLGIGAVAGVSLVVAGVLIMNITWVSVNQRVAEIGLLKALGASSRMIRRLFLTEALLLTAAGALSGLLLSTLLLALARWQWPALEFVTPWWAQCGSVAIALLVGTLFAWLPARWAGRLAPVDALSGRSG